MREFKRFFIDMSPKDDDLNKILEIAKTENCSVELTWFVMYSGQYRVIAHPYSTIEELRDMVPKIYAV